MRNDGESARMREPHSTSEPYRYRGMTSSPALADSRPAFQLLIEGLPLLPPAMISIRRQAARCRRGWPAQACTTPAVMLAASARTCYTATSPAISRSSSINSAQTAPVDLVAPSRAMQCGR